jgi:c-di-GMP-binding flagellar brake protein YcgR
MGAPVGASLTNVTSSKYIENLEPAGRVEDQRRHPRTREFGPQEVSVRRISPAETITARLWDFSYGGVGMETPKPLTVGEQIELTAKLLNKDYSMQVESTGRVVHCRSVGRDLYRVGVAFVHVTYHRLDQD